MIGIVKQHLQCAQHRMKVRADKSRSERSFEVGNKVFLKLQPYVQTSVATRANHKLAFKFYGPYKILEKIGNVAYRLDLPANSAVHPVVHVSQLKKSLSANDPKVIPTLPDDKVGLQIPLEVLDQRMVQQGGSIVHQALIRWSHLPVELASWEDLIALKQRFPFAPAWGQAGFQGRGNVSPLTTTEAAPADPSQMGWPRRSKRDHVRSVLVSRPEWV